ncbi:MAG TPA: Asp-tRNA(Asn)/Glu-tRNA(Gln) amidotransferase subunit GatA [Armatimonadota bacterium]|nr:Asp-tRNA(Asn)/Glu-tRNA(Gln) amidotransferase subunit GatA [Armatimonadota bacterium]HPP73659.1 Asp-tRNA(Asn)/Glu-tRNA(Gln) amidotransferase subunit GatA [Armatimonadota bacterium]
MVDKLYQLTAHELHDLISKKEVSCRDVTESVLDRIRSVDDRVKCYVTVTDELALAQADNVDKQIAAGEPLLPLAGIPFALKDNMCTRGVLTTCSSKILHNFKPVYDATVVERIVNNGGVIIGKTNLDEFAMGSSTENSAFFTTRNPWDIDRVPGGSSGGSTAAVAADEAVIALGSDTGGSIRQPAAFCGVVGFKPTYGRVSRYGLIAFASSLDQIGPITKDVTDCALAMNLIAGKDFCDSTSLDVPVPDYTKSLIPDAKGIKIGVPTDFFGQGVEPEIVNSVMKAVEVLKDLGAEYKETSMKMVDYGLPTYYIIAPAEASSNLARYDGVRFGLRSDDSKDPITMFLKTREEGFGPEVKQRIMIGTYALSAGYYDAYYLKAQKVRTLIRQDFERLFEEFDVLVAPTSPTVAFKVGERAADPFQMKLADVLTIPANMAGIPAISIPCGYADGLPIGLQIIGKSLDEATILRVAYAFEQATDYHKRKPEI